MKAVLAVALPVALLVAGGYVALLVAHGGSDE